MAKPVSGNEKNMSVTPLFDNVLVKPLELEAMSPGGIILPDSAKEKPQMGVIQAVGPGRVGKDGKNIPISVKVGQTVMYKKWGGNEIKMGREEWMLVEEKDILCIVNK